MFKDPLCICHLLPLILSLAPSRTGGKFITAPLLIASISQILPPIGAPCDRSPELLWWQRYGFTCLSRHQSIDIASAVNQSISLSIKNLPPESQHQSTTVSINQYQHRSALTTTGVATPSITASIKWCHSAFTTFHLSLTSSSIYLSIFRFRRPVRKQSNQIDFAPSSLLITASFTDLILQTQNKNISFNWSVFENELADSSAVESPSNWAWD